jgi:hypothetical protein
MTGAASRAAPFAGPLFASLDQVIDIISGVRDYSIEPYQARLHECLCPHCHMNTSGQSVRGDRCDCGLDSYLPAIVEIVEKELYAH